MSDRTDPYAPFRINLEQQQKRAKELLKTAKAGDGAALKRMQVVGFSAPEFKLAQAQHCIAHELRFVNWTALKAHIAAMDHTRGALHHILDDDCRTMHIRCGHDIQQTLKDAGLHGDFNLHINPYLQGPVTAAPDWLEQRARFIVDEYGPTMELRYEAVLEGCRDEEKRLASARDDYERVVMWFEHDRYDQFVLMRCLAWFAENGAPRRLELVGPSDFPGTARFIGLGQLPPEALRLLWEKRRVVSPSQIAFAASVWNCFRAPDPRPLAEVMRKGTPPLPQLAFALLRHLQELPALKHGLSLTQQLLLQVLAEHECLRVGRLVGIVVHQRDPLPGLGDSAHDAILRALAALPQPLVVRAGHHGPNEWHLDEVAVTAHGRSVLEGQQHLMEQPVPERWVGGVRIATGQRNWHWNEATREVTLR